MARDEHLFGHSEFYDRLRNAVFQNGLEIRISGGEAMVRILGAHGRPGREFHISDRKFVRILGAIILQLQREAWQSRQIRSEFKERKRRQKRMCETCGGRRLLEDPVTGEEWPCPSCNGG